MPTDQTTQLVEIPRDSLPLHRKIMITHIDVETKKIKISVSGGNDIQMEPPKPDGNQISIQPVMDTPSVALYDLKFELHESLQSQWRFQPRAAQFSVNQVPAGALFHSNPDGIFVTVPIYTNLHQEPDNLARYNVGLGFMESNSDTSVWIDDPTIILKPPTDG